MAATAPKVEHVERVRRSLALELPSCSFDDEVVEYLAHTLDVGEPLSEDHLVETWFPFLVSSGACKDEEGARSVCCGLLARLQSDDLPQEDAAISRLGKWLEELQLQEYSEQAHAWCARAGTANLEALLEHWQDFATELQLKPLERRRVQRDVAKRLADVKAPSRRPGTFGPPEDPDRYMMLEEIGEGVTAKVHRCARGQEAFAVKTISLTKLRLQPDFKRMSDKLHREVSILFSLRHPRIVTLYDVIEEPDQALRLVMELVEGGELFSRIVKQGSFSEALAGHVFLQIVEGLKFIHSKDIVHRDLKPENILVDERRSRGGLLEVKLSDFGHSKLINDGYSTAITRVGTPQYWAPEVSDPRRAALGYDQTADLWSLGVVLYVMLVGSYPFDGGGDRSGEQIRRVPFKSLASGRDVSGPAKDLVCSLIRVEPRERLSLGKCLRHAWAATAGATTGHEPKLPRALEVKIPLPTQPSKEQVRKLRGDLTKWQTKFCFAAAVKHQEVIVSYGEENRADKRSVDAAHQALQEIVDLHFGVGPGAGHPHMSGAACPKLN